jgi:CheY-like chemotaxis protein
MNDQKTKVADRVLIVDNDPLIRNWMISILEGEGYDSVSMTDGGEVYRVLQSDSDFKGAVLDLAMPGLDGPGLIRYMRTEERLMRIPVMVIIPEGHMQSLASGLAAGATVLLPEPFTRAQLQSTLRMMLRSKVEGKKSSLLIDLYLESAEREVKAIKAAAIVRDLSSMKQRVHALRGSSSTIGAGRVANLCEQLEETSEQSSAAATDQLVRQLESEFASARTALVAERRERWQAISV